jgi:hypothetical protein
MVSWRFAPPGKSPGEAEDFASIDVVDWTKSFATQRRFDYVICRDKVQAVQTAFALQMTKSSASLSGVPADAESWCCGKRRSKLTMSRIKQKILFLLVNKKTFFMFLIA